jgi:hypothetical protein
MAVAESYLASFRPVMPVPGFETVLSNIGTQALGKIPGEKAALQAQLASTALQEIGAIERLQRNLDAVSAENALTRSSNRKGGALRMAGELLAFALPGTAQAGVQVADPLALMNAIGDFNQTERRRRASNMLRSNSFVSEALKGLG